ncbi:hypothetical protein [Persicobacter sp. CCB-QB2]|uniref:gliding motility lipoprotein GldB n=1 Tax=Persicobacter sp. CCB-QB2 TaxID=1561025 RepID=UPI0006A9CB69|nr:hypothetical protein [Persicobacter sp. CCB-QB2]
MNFSKIKYFMVLLTAIACGCNQTEDPCGQQPNTENIALQLDFTSTASALKKISSKEEVALFLKNQPAFATLFLKQGQHPHDSILVNQLFDRSQHPAFQELIQESEKVFDQYDLKQEFEQAFKNIKYHYPEFKAPRIVTGVTGFDTNFQGFDDDLYVSDSLIIIGLDYFLGEGAKYRPNSMPQYILRRYSPEYIVPSVINQLADGFMRSNAKDRSMLADMIFYGKSYYFTKQILPCVADTVIIGYTEEEFKESKEHSKVIWASLVKNQMLYESGNELKKKFIGERPKTLEIGEKCPGRIGQWVGWEIVKKYMEENESADLKSLMANPNAENIFAHSKYKG